MFKSENEKISIRPPVSFVDNINFAIEFVSSYYEPSSDPLSLSFVTAYLFLSSFYKLNTYLDPLLLSRVV